MPCGDRSLRRPLAFHGEDTGADMALDALVDVLPAARRRAVEDHVLEEVARAVARRVLVAGARAHRDDRRHHRPAVGLLEEDLQAKNMILKAKFNDLILVGWQLGFSATVFAHMAYGLSEQVRANWATLGILAADSTKAIGPKGFGAQAFWYGVFFPGWDGYRVYHDPVYTAYFAPPPEDPVEEDTPGFEMFLALGALACVPVIKIFLSKRK